MFEQEIEDAKAKADRRKREAIVLQEFADDAERLARKAWKRVVKADDALAALHREELDAMRQAVVDDAEATGPREMPTAWAN